MNKRQEIVLLLLAVILESVGFLVLISYNWKIALVVFLIIWGNNISLALDK